MTEIAVGTALEDLTLAFVEEDSLAFLLIDNFILTALVEEGGKYAVLRLRTWRSPHFNFTFDAVVYAVCVSLGFATVENIFYVMDGSIETAVMRALLSVPGHAIDGVFMGFYYGAAKRDEWHGRERESRTGRLKALLVPVLLHGFYDFCLSVESYYFLILFGVFEIVVTVLAVRRVRLLSREDALVFPLSYPDGTGV